MLFSKRSGTESMGGNRHWPSAAIRAPMRVPSELFTTVEVGSLNRFLGRQNNHKTKMMKNTPILILWSMNSFFTGDKNLLIQPY